MGIPLVAGRDFADLRDTTAPPQAVVNEAFVGRFLQDLEPLGRSIRFGERAFTIVGVARTTTYEAFGEPPAPMIYLSYRDRPSARGEIHVRTRAGAETLLASEVQRAVRALNPMLPIYDIRTLGDHIEKNLFLRRIPARLFTVLGPILLALAAAGIYAVVSHVVANRRQEMALRMALGAAASRVISTVTADSFRSISAGLALGWAMAFAFNLHLGSGGFDGWAFGGVPVVLLAVAWLACWLPAHRASQENPMTLLKQETT
jgi:ABC-type antimicrobial peptide transport system permease subunit